MSLLLCLGAQLDSVLFQLTSGAAVLVTYSLTCTSSGGPINTLQWDRDGVSVDGDNIYPILTDSVTATYTNTLQVSGRQTGVYTCTATDGGDILSLSQSLTVEGMYFRVLGPDQHACNCHSPCSSC